MEYKELDLHDHVLVRPDTYVGSTNKETTNEYMAILTDDKNIKMKYTEITHTPAMLRIFVEALSNAVDNVVRSKEYNVPCKSIKVNIDIETG